MIIITAVFINVLLLVLIAVYIKKHVSEKHKTLAVHDLLTGAYNYNYLAAYLPGEISRAERYGHVFSIMYYDIDNFKAVNEQHGTAAGNNILKELSEYTCRCIRSSDILVRLHDDKFMIIFSGTDKHGLMQAAEKIFTSIKARNFPLAGHVAISAGLTVFEDKDSIETIIQRADNALSESKKAGKNRFTFI